MRIAIIGASGLVGSHCHRVFKAMGWDVVGTHFGYATPATHLYDTLNPGAPGNYDLAAFAPDWIIHCGALTHVDRCEADPEASYQQTVVSTQHLLALTLATGAHMVYLGTDYVFDGLVGPYAETDAVNPISVYGQHKLAAEELVMAVPGNLAVRITNVYGEEARGKNFIERLLLQLLEEESPQLRLPDDQYATPIYAGDVALALANLIRDGRDGLWHLASTDYLSRLQLARRVAGYFPHLSPGFEGVPTAELAQPAPRPLRGGLLALKFQRAYPAFDFSTVDSYLRRRLQTPKP